VEAVFTKAFARLVVRLAVVTIVAAIVMVPTVMRSRQHIELRDSTRLSIRLNWQGYTPPQKHLLAPSAHDRIVITRAVLIEPETPRRWPTAGPTDQPVRQTPLDNAPDLFRGPPSLFI
jgi:hypothetical protein